MKYEFELTLTVRSVSDGRPVQKDKLVWDTQSIDRVVGESLTSLLGQFLIVLASVHNRIMNDFKLERSIFDDDIPF